MRNLIKITACVVLTALACMAGNLNEKQKEGKKIYDTWCLPCHGAGMPGTNALGVLYKDSGIPANLEERTDITPEFVALFVRQGKHSMPFFRKTEINDKELVSLGEYLSRNSK